MRRVGVIVLLFYSLIALIIWYFVQDSCETSLYIGFPLLYLAVVSFLPLAAWLLHRVHPNWKWLRPAKIILSLAYLVNVGYCIDVSAFDYDFGNGKPSLAIQAVVSDPSSTVHRPISVYVGFWEKPELGQRVIVNRTDGSLQIAVTSEK